MSLPSPHLHPQTQPPFNKVRQGVVDDVRIIFSACIPEVEHFLDVSQDEVVKIICSMSFQTCELWPCISLPLLFSSSTTSATTVIHHGYLLYPSIPIIFNTSLASDTFKSAVNYFLSPFWGSGILTLWTQELSSMSITKFNLILNGINHLMAVTLSCPIKHGFAKWFEFWGPRMRCF